MNRKSLFGCIIKKSFLVFSILSTDGAKREVAQWSKFILKNRRIFSGYDILYHYDARISANTEWCVLKAWCFSSLTRLFGFVARKQGSTTDNVSHLFAELDPDQPASAIASFVSKMMKRWKLPTPKWQWPFWNLPSSLVSFSPGLDDVLFLNFCCLSVCFCFPSLFFLSALLVCLDFGLFSKSLDLKDLLWIQSGTRGCVVWSCERDKHGGHWREKMYWQGNLY